MQQREELLKKEQKKRDQLESKIKAMESKLLAGSVLDRSDETKKALEKKRQEVIEQKVKKLRSLVFDLVYFCLLSAASVRYSSSWRKRKRAH